MFKDSEYKTYAHNPPHLFQPATKYFFTCATYKKKHYLKTDNAKILLFSSILTACDQYGWKLEDWVILDNHYHLMLTSPGKSLNLAKMMGDVHRFTSLRLKNHYPELKSEKKIFHNYWDTCITYDGSYLSRLNYILLNPVKHGYVEHPNDYPWSSYRSRYREDKELLELMIDRFPCGKVNVVDEF